MAELGTTSTKIGGARRLATENLKCCPLCRAVNAAANGECFVCRWHGAFIEEPAVVEAALVELLDRCPELADALSELPEPPAPWWRRLADVVARWRAASRSRTAVVDLRV